MQLTAAVSFLTILQEESVSAHTYAHSFLQIILLHLEHRDAGQGGRLGGCPTPLVIGHVTGWRAGGPPRPVGRWLGDCPSGALLQAVQWQ